MIPVKTWEVSEALEVRQRLLRAPKRLYHTEGWSALYDREDHSLLFIPPSAGCSHHLNAVSVQLPDEELMLSIGIARSYGSWRTAALPAVLFKELFDGLPYDLFGVKWDQVVQVSWRLQY